MASKQQTVLVVDYEAAIADLVKLFLEREGYRVLRAENGVEGLECFRKSGGADLVVADVLMPKLSGTDMVREMLRYAPDLKVLFITGYTDETVQARTEEFPFEVIRKPFKPDHFLARVRDTLRSG